ncbi:MAG TPA: cell division protein ZapA [Erythrobacter sp.]|nr:cell division protein ZapA [Erythrobacter sp.]
MSEVGLRIGGKTYMVACGEGEEAQLVKLGNMIDAKLQTMEGNLSAQDAQNLLFAALLLADELDETKDGGGTTDDKSGPTADQLEQLADKIEKCASKLESCLAGA